ncbi:hypothetical protein H4R18_005904 [Coemansia javaensis]|uniref:Uncharacterized protein n=1 Tax=Coemansia javaensis TaxID=2761396 RepID=A0A9W8LDL9_9FUNG|nr:hypothetical protein H4R18_005904 [Coemansia javaensis]
MLSRCRAVLGRQLRPAAAGPAARAIARRSYTNTSVYTRSDWMSPDEVVKMLIEEDQHLAELLKADDSQAPWCRDSVAMVSREVQEHLRVPETWTPEAVFR